jgi:hypothetical protein
MLSSRPGYAVSTLIDREIALEHRTLRAERVMQVSILGRQVFLRSCEDGGWSLSKNV